MKNNIRNIAKESNTSISTVSRVLNNSIGVKSDVRKRVIEVIRKNKYDPYANHPVQPRVVRKSIRAILPHEAGPGVMADHFYTKGLKGIKDSIENSGYDLVINNIQEAKSYYRNSGINQSILKEAEGVVFLCPVTSNWEADASEFLDHGMPVTVINRTSRMDRVISVTDKREEGIEAGIGHLMGIGYKDILIIARESSVLQTPAICRRIAERNGLELGRERLINFSGQFENRILSTRIEEMISDEKLPEAIFAIGDRYAISIIKYFHQRGIRVPQDVAVMGFDNIPVGKAIFPELTTVNCPLDEMAAYATKFVMDRIEGSQFKPMEVSFKCELVIRDSCGA